MVCGKSVERSGRALSRTRKGRRARRQAAHRLANLHRRGAHQRAAWHWATAHDLAVKFDALAFADLNLQGRPARWGRKVGDLGCADYRLKQAWLGEKYRRLFVQIPRFGPTTKRLHCGGHIQSVSLSERIVVCQGCGLVHDSRPQRESEYS